jgi:hypothetical protein
MVAYASSGLLRLLERTVAFNGRVPLAGLQLVAESQAHGQTAEENSSNHFVDRRLCEGF